MPRTFHVEEGADPELAEVIKNAITEGDKLRDQEMCTGGCGKSMKNAKPEDFKDALSIKEFGISGLCQQCQDAFFDMASSED